MSTESLLQIAKQYRGGLLGIMRAGDPLSISQYGLSYFDALRQSVLAGSDEYQLFQPIDPEPFLNITEDRIAIVQLAGFVENRRSMLSYFSQTTDCETLERVLRDLGADDSVQAILIDCNSHGGDFHGVDDVANVVAQVRLEGTPVYAIAHDNLHSSAYWICSPCKRIYGTSTALIGSIGVLAIHQEYSVAEAMEGTKTTIVKAGEFKAAGNPHARMKSKERRCLQEKVDDIYDLMTESISAFRSKLPIASRDDWADGTGHIASKAKELGLIDRIGTFEDVLDDIRKQL